MAIRSVKVSNVSLGAYEQDMKEFFIFSGEIEYVEMHGDNDRSQIAYITFKEPQGAETAVLLTGAQIVDQLVTIELAPDYKLPLNVFIPPAAGSNGSGQAEGGYKKAEDVVSTMLAKGFIISKEAVNKAKSFDEKHKLTSTASAKIASFDEKHKLTSTASAKIASFDQKIGFTEKINAGTIIVNEKMREVDQKFQVSEKTKSAYAAAEQSVSNAGSAIMKNPYVSAGALWVSAAYNRVAKAAEDVGLKTREKILAEEQAQKPEGHAHINEYKSPKAAKSETSEQPFNPATEKSFVLNDHPSNPSTEQSFFLSDHSSSFSSEQDLLVSEQPSNPSSEGGLIVSVRPFNSLSEDGLIVSEQQPSNPSSEQKIIL